MLVRLIARSMLAGFLAAGLFLLMPMRASAASVTITECPDGVNCHLGEPPENAGNVTATATGLDPFQTHPPFNEEVGFHGEWNTTDPNIDQVFNGTDVYKLNFQFCEDSTKSCDGFFTTPANELPDLTPAGITLSGGGWVDSNGLARSFLSDFAVTLIDQETVEDPNEGPGTVSGVFVPNLSDILQLTFSRLDATSHISVDATFESDQQIPEPASLVLLGTGLIGAGLKYRRRRKSQE